MPNYILTRNLQQNFNVTAASLDAAKALVYAASPTVTCTFERDTLEGRMENPTVGPVVPAPVTTAPKVIPDLPVPDVIRHMQEQAAAKTSSTPTPV